MMEEIYFDNSATTVCTPSVRDAVVHAMTEEYGNPSSRHVKGIEAEKLLKQAAQTIAGTLHASEKEIFFTSGGTESDNWALIGTAFANRRAGNHIITTAVEHEAVLQPAKYLQDQGFSVTFLSVDRTGAISLEELKKALRKDTILVSVMTVNNEVGRVQPVEEAARLVKEYDPGIVFHTDAVQAYGKIPLDVRKLKADLLSVSGHKIHGPKGTGFLYIRERTKIHPLILGGGQQRGMRSGTDNVPGAAGLSQAAKDAYDHLEENRKHLNELKEYMTKGLLELPDVVIHSSAGEEGAPHIVSAAFTGVRSEVLLHALEDRGIYVSSGSACASNRKPSVSPVLSQMKLPMAQMESTLRFSFSELNTKKEVDTCLAALREFLPVLRRYRRR